MRVQFHISCQFCQTNEFDKDNRVLCPFMQIYWTSVQQKCCHGSIEDDILIKADAKNGP